MITNIEEPRQKYESLCGKPRVERSLEGESSPTLNVV